MIKATLWYCTPLTKPDRYIDGPFQSRSDCEARCIQLASDDARRSIVTQLLEGVDISAVSTLYVPHPVSMLERLPIGDANNKRLLFTAPSVSTRNVPPSLLKKLQALPRSKLSRIAVAIGLHLDHDKINKPVLAQRIYRELHANANSTPVLS